MPQHKAAVKHMRTSKKRRERNKAIKSMAKSSIKRVMGAEKKEDGEAALVSASSMIDKLARKGIIHKNTASRRKSKLARNVNKLEG